MILKAADIRLGSLILYEEEAPTPPSISEQAKVVAEFSTEIVSLMPSIMEPTDFRKQLAYLKQLGEGDLSIKYKQRPKEEVEAEKERMTIRGRDGQVFMPFDEILMDRLVLPVDDQLYLDFSNAYAQKWGAEHGRVLSWEEWDEFRKKTGISNPTYPRKDFKPLQR